MVVGNHKPGGFHSLAKVYSPLQVVSEGTFPKLSSSSSTTTRTVCHSTEDDMLRWIKSGRDLEVSQERVKGSILAGEKKKTKRQRKLLFTLRHFMDSSGVISISIFLRPGLPINIALFSYLTITNNKNNTRDLRAMSLVRNSPVDRTCLGTGTNTTNI